MVNSIILANLNDFEDVRNITHKTISLVYPRYYPAGAVRFFCEHHCDEHIIRDISEGRVFLLQVGEKFIGTVTVSDNNINRLFVLPEYQKNGYGNLLLAFAEDKIAENYDSVVIDASLPAKKIYKKRGYVEIDYNTIETGNGDYLCYDLMKKTLV